MTSGNHNFTNSGSGYRHSLSRGLTLEPTANTPFVNFCGETGHLEIRGNSTRLGIESFYWPIMDSLEQFLVTESSVKLSFLFSDLNSTTVKLLFDTFKKLRTYSRSGKLVVINWHSEEDNDAMLETGKDFAELYGLKFNFVLE